MAVGTESIAVFSFVQIIIGICGLGLLFLTVWYTRRAALATETTLNHAFNTLQEAKSTTSAVKEGNEASILFERAMICVDGLDITENVILTGETAAVHFMLLITNLGRSPGYISKAVFTIYVGKAHELKSHPSVILSLPNKTITHDAESRSVPPNQPVTVKSSFALPRSLWGISAITGNAAYMCGRVTFTDVLSKSERWSAFGYMIAPSPNDGPGMTKTFRLTHPDFWESN